MSIEHTNISGSTCSSVCKSFTTRTKILRCQACRLIRLQFSPFVSLSLT
uniref:Uncharacterized protein n=1 Tax=Arundo donax TaxID=35708 RepID=A0A0A8Y998_ARUDO